MFSDHLAFRDNPLAFEVINLHKYSQNITNFIGIDIAMTHFSRMAFKKVSHGNINSNKIYEILRISMYYNPKN